MLDPIETKDLTSEDVDDLVLRTRQTMLREVKLISDPGFKAQKSQ